MCFLTAVSSWTILSLSSDKQDPRDKFRILFMVMGLGYIKVLNLDIWFCRVKQSRPKTANKLHIYDTKMWNITPCPTTRENCLRHVSHSRHTDTTSECGTEHACCATSPFLYSSTAQTGRNFSQWFNEKHTHTRTHTSLSSSRIVAFDERRPRTGRLRTPVSQDVRLTSKAIQVMFKKYRPYFESVTKLPLEIKASPLKV